MNNPSNAPAIIRGNWARVVDEVAEVAERAGRSAEEVTIVGVTKYVDASLARALVEAGCVRLGENRPQALWDKAEALRELPIQWHLIGHLQRNKVRRTLPLVTLIHSVDSVRLAEAISQEAAAGESKVPDSAAEILLEVNVSGDAAKDGVPPEAVLETLDALAPLAGVRVRGLMAMAGLESDPEAARREFAILRKCRDQALERGVAASQPLDQLSMGMSDDFPLAIAEGATIVRIGSRLFAGAGR